MTQSIATLKRSDSTSEHGLAVHSEYEPENLLVIDKTDVDRHITLQPAFFSQQITLVKISKNYITCITQRCALLNFNDRLSEQSAIRRR